MENKTIFNSKTRIILKKNFILKEEDNNILNSSFNPSFDNSEYNLNKLLNNNNDINNNIIISNNQNIINNSQSYMNNNTNIILNSSSKNKNYLNDLSNKSEKIKEILKSKKIKIDLSKKSHQDNIKLILDNIIKCENNFNNILSHKSKYNNSPCIILPKDFIEDLKKYFNYDYYKSTKNFDINKILEQRNNNNIIYINDIKDLSKEDFINNNICILDENTFYSLYMIAPHLEQDLNKRKECNLYLLDEKGIIIIDEQNKKYLFIFEVNDYDINQMENYELINFEDNEKYFNEIKNILNNTKNLTMEIWNELIFVYSNNINFVVNKKNDINTNINNLSFKISSFREYLQNYLNNNNYNNEIFLEKLKIYENSLNKYEELLNEKEKLIKNQSMNNNMNNNMNMNNMTNSRNININHDYINNLAFSTIILNNNNNNVLVNNNNLNGNNSNNDIFNDVLINGEVKINKFGPSLGLANIGSTCYMNATLQCLAHLPELSEELIKIYITHKNNDFNNFIKTNRLTVEFTLLLIQIFFPKNNEKFVAPYNMKQIIGNQNSLFNGFEAEDAKDLLLFLIETMNTELNGGVSPIYNDIIRLGINQRDQVKVKQTFLNDFYSKNFSPISKIFYGFAQTFTFCQVCNNTLYNYECFNFLIFPLLDIKHYIFKNNNNIFNPHILSLKDCFEYYQKYDHYGGDNKLYCNNCGCLQDSRVQRVIDKTPPILIIILDRGLNNQDFQDQFDYDVNLDLSNFVPHDTYTKYYLCGVITHQGESGPSGHFLAFCKMDFNSPWYLYNDSSVSECQDISEMVIDRTPYILFYHKY